MEFLLQPTFTVFLALVLSFLVAKIVSLAVSNSAADANTVASSVSEGAVAKDEILDRESIVRRGKGEKRVKFVDDVVIRRVDRYEGSENLVFLDDVGELGEVIETSEERVDQFEVRKSEEECFDEREMDDDDDDALVEGSEKTEMLLEEEADGDDRDGVGGEHVVKSVCVEEQEREVREVELEGDGMVIDEREGNGGVGCGENEGIVAGDVVEEKGRDESIDDDWEGVERSELEKGFAEAVNYVECGGKEKEDDNRLMKLGSDVQMQLYGLHKVALEGPCREPQPMALMVSSRAKWNAWQRLGSMSRDVAMEQYIQVLSQNIPEWMHGDSASADDDIQRKMEPNDEISVAELERKLEVSTANTSQSSVDKVDAV